MNKHCCYQSPHKFYYKHIMEYHVDISEFKPKKFSNIWLKQYRNATENLRAKSEIPVQNNDN